MFIFDVLESSCEDRCIVGVKLDGGFVYDGDDIDNLQFRMFNFCPACGSELNIKIDKGVVRSCK